MQNGHRTEGEPCSLTFLLQVAAAQTKLASRRQCLEDPLCLTSDQALVIRILLENEEGLVQGELARRAGKDAPCLSRILVVMEKKGLVCRRKDEKDRRVWRVFVTDDVGRASSRLGCDLDEAEERLLSGFSTNEAAELRRMLWRVITNCKDQFGVESSLLEEWSGECGCDE